MILEAGRTYHVKGWNYKAVFVLQSVTGDVAYLVTPKTRKAYKVKKDRLFYTHKSRLKLKPKEA